MTDQDSNMQRFALVWDKTAPALWGADYPNRLAGLLDSKGVRTILDCAGGTGFPALTFKQMGWNITYSDGSKVMLDFFKEKLAEQNLSIPTYQAFWDELPTKVPGTYDAVLCRGNSFIGIASYQSPTQIDREQALQTMRLALQGMLQKVSDGGFLYIDLPTPQHARPPQPYHTHYTDNLTFETYSTITYDPTTDLRHATEGYINLLSGQTTQSNITSTPLDRQVLIDLLLEAGFQRVEKSPLEEAFYIDAYMAFK